MIVTETMPVTFPPIPPPPTAVNQVTFTITNPTSPLFLGTLHVDGLPSGANGIGTLAPIGSAQSPSVHSFHLGNQKFQELVQSLRSNPSPLSISITYDNISLVATDLRLFVMLMAANG